MASVAQGYGNLLLTPEIQAAFVAEAPHVFLPVSGGWGRMGATHIRLAEADRAVVKGAFQTAWKLRSKRMPPRSRAAQSIGAGANYRSRRARRTAAPTRRRERIRSGLCVVSIVLARDITANALSRRISPGEAIRSVRIASVKATVVGGATSSPLQEER